MNPMIDQALSFQKQLLDWQLEQLREGSKQGAAALELGLASVEIGHRFVQDISKSWTGFLRTDAA